jgi:hypothetical protein
LLSREGEGIYPGSVEAGISAGGEANVAWASNQLRATSHTPASGWGRSMLVAKSEETTYETQILLDAHRHTKIVFSSSSYKGGRVRTVSLGAGGRPRSPRTVYSRRSDFSPSEVTAASDERGETIVAWVDGDRTETVQALTLAASGKPEGPLQTFPRRKGQIEQLQVKTNAQGDALLAWHRRAPARLRGIEVATRLHGGRFSRVARVSRTRDVELTAAIEPDAHMALLFTHILGNKAAAVEMVSSRGGGWTAPQAIAPSPPSTSTFEPQLAASPLTNELVAIWNTAPTEPPGLPIAVSVPGRESLPPNACAAKPLPYTPETLEEVEGLRHTKNRIEASTQVGEEGWRPPVVLSEGGSPAALTISPSGTPLAAWTKTSAQKETIYLSEYQPSK